MLMGTSMNRTHSLMTSVFISALLLIAIGMVWGFYYEDTQVVLVELLYYARPNEMLVHSWINDYDFLLVPLWASLAQLFKGIPTYAFWQLLQPLIWLSAYIYFILRKLDNIPPLLKALGIFTLVVISLDSLISQVCFRNSIYLAGAALLFTRHGLMMNEKQGVGPILLFVFALIPRSHPAAIVLLFFVGYEILSGLDVRKVITAHLPHFMACIVVIGAYQLYSKYDDANTGKIIESEYEYAWFEKGAYKPLGNMKTKQDSLKYWALQNWFMSDSAEFNLEFFDRVIDRDKHYNDILSWKKWFDAAVHIKDMTIENWHFFLLLLALMLFVVLANGTYHQTTAMVATYILLNMLLLVLVVESLKERFFIPFTSLLIFTIIIDALSKYKDGKHPHAFSFLIISSIALLSLHQINKSNSISQQYKNADIQAKKDMQILYDFSKKTPLILTTDVPMPQVRNIFHRYGYNVYEHIAWLEAAYLIYYPQIEFRAKNVAGFSPLDFKTFQAALLDRRNLRLLATPERIHIIQRYSRGIHDCEMTFFIDNTIDYHHKGVAAYGLYSMECNLGHEDDFLPPIKKMNRKSGEFSIEN